MPCRYDGCDTQDRAMVAWRLDTATRLLCHLMRTKEFDHPEIQEWWEEHKELDAKRLQDEEEAV